MAPVAALGAPLLELVASHMTRTLVTFDGTAAVYSSVCGENEGDSATGDAAPGAPPGRTGKSTRPKRVASADSGGGGLGGSGLGGGVVGGGSGLGGGGRGGGGGDGSGGGLGGLGCVNAVTRTPHSPSCT